MKTVFVAVLKRFNGDNRNASANVGASYAPTLFAKEREAKTAMASKEELAGAMRTLLEERVIIQDTYGKPSNPHYRLVYNTHRERGEEEPF